MAGNVFVPGRTPAVKRALVERATEAGVDLNEIKVAQGGYTVPEELAPKKESRRKRRDKDDDPGEGDN